jgi:hypothetical protein
MTLIGFTRNGEDGYFWFRKKANLYAWEHLILKVFDSDDRLFLRIFLARVYKRYGTLCPCQCGLKTSSGRRRICLRTEKTSKEQTHTEKIINPSRPRQIKRCTLALGFRGIVQIR